MDEMDQPKLISSMWQSGSAGYCTYLMHLIRAQSFPTWRKLCHFKKIMDVGYTDATKLKDLVKVSNYYDPACKNNYLLYLDFPFCIPQCDQKAKAS